MAIISTDIGPSAAGEGFADRGLDILVSPESVTRLPSPVASEFDSETKLVQDVGSRLHEYETTNKRLHADLLDAADEKQQLVDALRELHGQFHVLQRHADKQRETLMSEGEELRVCRQRIALLQKELATIRADYERSAKQEDVNESSTNTGKYEYVVASYREALRDMRRKLARQQTAFTAQKKAQVELLRKMQSLEQRAEEFEGQYIHYAKAEAELRKCLADREKQIARMNNYIVRMQRELKFLSGGLHSQKVAVNVSESKHDEIGRESEKALTERLDVRQQPQQFVIVPVGNEIERIQFPLNKKILTVGRSPENDIPVCDKSISRVHARIILDNSGVTVEDLKSTNGLRVNSEHKKRYAIKHGDRFRLGRVEFELVNLAIRASGLQPWPAT